MQKCSPRGGQVIQVLHSDFFLHGTLFVRHVTLLPPYPTKFPSYQSLVYTVYSVQSSLTVQGSLNINLVIFPSLHLSDEHNFFFILSCLPFLFPSFRKPTSTPKYSSQLQHQLIIFALSLPSPNPPPSSLCFLSSPFLSSPFLSSPFLSSPS